MQPYLLELYGNSEAYGIAGLAAAVVAGAQIFGGLLVPQLKRVFRSRTTILLTAIILNTILLVLIGLVTNLIIVIALLVLWALIFAAKMPIRQSYINEMIPSKQRATVLSFDSLIGNSGGIVAQPVLGKVADIYSYSFSFICAAIIQIIAFPFIFISKKQKSEADQLK
jgi:MFS family permease